MAMNKNNIMSKIKAEGRSVSGWARFRGHCPGTVVAILNSRIRPGTYSYKAITADLRADGYMTDEDEQ
jgi:hypothetical protein